MSENIKSIIFYIIAIFLVTIIFVGFNVYREKSLLKTMQNTLYEYFEDTNSHISSHNFSISNTKIKCRGNNAYLVEFNLNFTDKSNEFDKLGAVVYKNKDTWNVKGLGSGLTNDELKEYHFKCYD